MDSQDQMSSLDTDTEAGNDLPASVSPIRLIRMKDIMANQCFQMNVKVTMAKLKKPSETADADLDADLSKYEDLIEQARHSHFNKTLALNRMQVWNAISDKLLQSDDAAMSLKATVDENADLCEKTMKVIKETRDLQDQIMYIQKERLELKGSIKKKMQEITELKQMGENQTEAQKRAMERAEAILQKYKKIASISQNVLRGIILASRVNWLDDPKLKDIALGLESIPD